MKKTSILVVVVLCVGLGLWLRRGITRNTLQSTLFAQKYARLLSEGKLAQAYALCSKAFRAHTTRKTFDKVVGMLRQSSSFTPREVFVSFRRSSVRAILKGPQGRQYKLVLHIRKEKGAYTVSRLAARESVVGVGQRFFALLRAGKDKQAYALTSRAFQKTYTPDSLTKLAPGVDWASFQGARWYAIDNLSKTGRLHGVLVFKGSKELRAKIEMTREHGAWMLSRAKLGS